MEKIISLLEQTSKLLSECGATEKSNWFNEKIIELKNTNNHDLLIEINNILGGQGSFSDLSLIPGKESKLSQEEARNIQWELTEKLSEEISNVVSRT